MLQAMLQAMGNVIGIVNQDKKKQDMSSVIIQKQGQLSDWLNSLYKEKINCTRSPKEVADITDAVTEMVRGIITELGQADDRFENCTETLVGSAKERSKVGEPNEFDFLIKLYSLSLTPGVRFARKCRSDRPGYAHVTIDGDSSDELRKTWSDMLSCGRLKSTDPVSKTGLRNLYASLLEDAIKQLQENCKDFVARSSGILKLQPSVKKFGPSCMCLSRWIPTQEYGGDEKALDIEIDTVLAKHATGVENVIDMNKDIPDKWVMQILKESETFMVIPCGRASCEDGLCFRLTFTNSEMILYNKLSPHHRKCFKILKYLMKVIEPEKNEQCVLFSYALKAFVMQHDKVCSKDDDDDDESALGRCVISLLKDVKACLAARNPTPNGSDVRITLPSICLKTHNIYDKDLKERPLVEKERGIDTMIKALEQIEASPENATPDSLQMGWRIMNHLIVSEQKND